MLTVDQLEVSFGGQQALQGFSGEFAAGQVTALIGGDGAGKSTLLRALAGVVSPSAGQIRFPAGAHRQGYQPVGAGVWAHLTVEENLVFAGRAHRLSRQEIADRIVLGLRKAGLEEARARLASQLSGGMRRKLAFLVATIHQPEILIIDEPTTGVDAESRQQIMQLIRQAAQDGALVVMATTYVDEAAAADAVFLMDKGKTLAAGSPKEICAAASLLGDGEVHTLMEANIAFLQQSAGEDPLASRADADASSQSAAAIFARGKPAQERSLVHVEKLHRKYGDFPALKDVSIQLQAGEVVGLLGGNGAGKTTLMRIILGLEKPTSGTAQLLGSHPGAAARRKIGYVAQGLGLYAGLSAEENLQFAAQIYGCPLGKEAKKYAQSLGNKSVAQLSLGARRTLAYLLATGHTPEVLILDEPTSGMDALERSRLWKAIRRQAAQGVGVLVTTHYRQEAELCDRLVHLEAGQVIA